MPHVLVIDDDPLFRTLINGALRKGYAVETAADGHEGYQAALEKTPGLIVLDLVMPTWDGVQTLRAFRADETLAGVPVVILTGAGDEPELDEIRELGVAGVLLKTEFSGDLLKAAVAEAFAPAAEPAAPKLFRGESIPVDRQRFDE